MWLAIPISNVLYEMPKYYISKTFTTAQSYLALKPAEVKMPPQLPLWKLAAATGPYVRLAALNGAVAVMLGAYGAHRQYPESDKENQKQIFETASRYHFIHALAMLGLPLCRARFLAATFLLSGVVLFCGTCYYHALTGDKQFNRLTPVGGVCLIAGWLSMCI